MKIGFDLDRLRPALGTCRAHQSCATGCAALFRRMGYLSPPSPWRAVVCRERRAAIAFLAVISPWFVRNYEVFHRVVPFRDNMGLFSAWHKGKTSLLGSRTNSVPGTTRPSGRNSSSWANLGYLDKKKQQAIEFIRANPGWYAGQRCGGPFSCGLVIGAWIANISCRNHLIRRTFFSATTLLC